MKRTTLLLALGIVLLFSSPAWSQAVEAASEAAKALNQLIQQTGDSPTDLFRKAIALYKVTKEAIQEGKVVGIAETEDGLETRFVGL